MPIQRMAGKMGKLKLNDVTDYVKEHIGEFHQSRLLTLENLKLSRVLKHKNPYLFKTKNILTSEMIVRSLVDAYISSNEETIFGNWLEGLAIFINEKVYGGIKSSAQGIDLEFLDKDVRYIVAIKSGPNWGNSSQIKKMKLDFTRAKQTLRTSGAKTNIQAINGCCYGRDNKPDKGDYFKYCGQKFWEFISGNENLYTDIIEPLGHDAKNKNDEYNLSLSNMINRFTKDFSEEFCENTGEINWDKLVQFNSSINPIKSKLK